MEYELAVVKWWDAFYCESIMGVEEGTTDATLVPVVSVGLITHECKHDIQIVQSIYQGHPERFDGRYGSIITIPRGMIQSMERQSYISPAAWPEHEEVKKNG